MTPDLYGGNQRWCFVMNVERKLRSKKLERFPLALRESGHVVRAPPAARILDKLSNELLRSRGNAEGLILASVASGQVTNLRSNAVTPLSSPATCSAVPAGQSLSKWQKGTRFDRHSAVQARRKLIPPPGLSHPQSHCPSQTTLRVLQRAD